jgi:hypothetical protein
MRVAVRTSFTPPASSDASSDTTVTAFEEGMSASLATRSLCALYASLSDDVQARASFFRVLSDTLALDTDKLATVINATAASADGLSNADLTALREALTPGYEQFWQQVVSHCRGGVPFLVTMRADLLKLIKAQKQQKAPQLQVCY